MTGDQVPQRRGRGSPQAEGAVDVQPRTGPFDRVGHCGEVVEHAGVHLPGLGADDLRAVDVGQGGAQRIGIHPAIGEGVHDADLREPDAEIAESAVDGRVTQFAHEDGDRRCAGEPVLDQVPAGGGEHVLPRRRETGEVSGLTARDEREGGVRGNPEQLLRPGTGGVLDDDTGRTERDQPEVLVPRRHEPVRCERGRQGGPDHEAEVATALAGDDSGFNGGRELLDHLRGIRRSLGKRRVEH